LIAYLIGIEIFALTLKVDVSDIGTVTVRDWLLLPCQQASRTLQRQPRNLLNGDDANVRVNSLPYNFNIEK